MKVVGFSFIRNAVKLQYPIVEAVRSILPLCDEVIVAVGKSDDNTRELVAAIDPKVKIIDTVWNDASRKDGRVLAEETDKVFQAVAADADWCVYIQGDEVMHESGHAEVMEAMKKWKDHKEVDGLLFNYIHFFGSYDYVGAEGHWFRNEIRVVRNDKSIWSYRDAQGFRKGHNKKLRVKPLRAMIYHYGWVQNPRTMKAKFVVKDKIYHNKDGDEDNIVVAEDFPLKLVKALHRFSGTHPQVMEERVKNIGWTFEFDVSKNSYKLKDRFKTTIEKITGWRPFEYRNYKII
jgi:glycosyltransferase involved in cell wall biosynthesis